jgi:predicted PurR-regulated permease PerM
MSNETRKDARYFLVFLLAVFLGLTILLISGFATPLVLGLVFSGLAYNWYKKLLPKLKNNQNLAALIMLLLIVAVIIIPLVLIGTTLFIEAVDFLTVNQNRLNFSNYPQMAVLETWANQYGLDVESTIKQVVPSIKSLSLYISGQIGNIFSNVVNFFLGFFIMMVTIFYFLRDGKRIGRFLVDVSPLKTSNEVHLYKTFRKVGGAIFFGNFISGLIQGALGALGFIIFGIGSPVLWGVVMGFLALIPLLGPYLIFIPAAVFLFITGTVPATIGFLLYNIIIVSGIDNLIKPKLIGDKIKIHPLLVLLSILGGLQVFGIMGIIYGPLIVAILTTVLHIYVEKPDKDIDH